MTVSRMNVDAHQESIAFTQGQIEKGVKLNSFRRIKIGLALFATIFLMSGCSVPNSESVSAQWQGKSINQAIAAYGPPSRTVVLPDGITIYVWEEQYGSSNAPSRATCRRGLHVNANGVIVGASQLSESLLCS